jgi:hypothetical protein
MVAGSSLCTDAAVLRLPLPFLPPPLKSPHYGHSRARRLTVVLYVVRALTQRFCSNRLEMIF